MCVFRLVILGSEFFFILNIVEFYFVLMVGIFEILFDS